MPPKANKNEEDEIDDVDEILENIEDEENEEEELVETEEKNDEEEEDDTEYFEIAEYDEETVAETEPPKSELIRTKKVIPANERCTSDTIGKYEMASIIGFRAKSLENGAKSYIDGKYCSSVLEIAILEAKAKKIPVAIIRKVGNNFVEVWRFSELKLCPIPPMSNFV